MLRNVDAFYGGDVISCLFEQITTWSETLRPYAAGDLSSGTRSALPQRQVSEGRPHSRRLDTFAPLGAVPRSNRPSGDEHLAASIIEAAGDGLSASEAAISTPREYSGCP